ncbi:hypothetical protein GW17_00034573 [Ensete ventricosum]|nr:hypothetical protein GW17_00034573 [Ensete ventricosum]
MVINFAQIRVSIDVSCTVLKFQNTRHSQCIHGSHTSTVSRKNVIVINFVKSRVSINFRATSQNFKILAIPNVLAHGKSYEHGFT